MKILNISYGISNEERVKVGEFKMKIPNEIESSLNVIF